MLFSVYNQYISPLMMFMFKIFVVCLFWIVTVPLVHSTNLASAAAQNYAKYHHHHQLHSTSTPGSAVSASATNNNGGCTYKSHITRSPQRHPTGITVIDSPISSNANSKRKRSWSRAVFSQLQRKGLEIQFQIQKYITKPDRRKLAARLGLTDAQVSEFMW